MKKIKSLYEILIYSSLIMLLSIIVVIIIMKYNSNTILVIIAYMCIAFIAVAIIKLLAIPSYIIINDNQVKAINYPLLATNKYYEGKRSLILYNREIYINDIEKLELIKLTKEEQITYTGYRHLFNKYLKFSLKYGSPKYIYVGIYSTHQIDKIIEFINRKILAW